MPAGLLGGSLHCAAAAAARAAHVHAQPCRPRAPRRRLHPLTLAAAAGAGAAGASTDTPGAGSTQQRQHPARLALDGGTTEVHKAVNAQLCAAETAQEVVQLVEQQLPAFNVVNAVTAFHRIAKAGQRLPPREQSALQGNPAVGQLAAALEPEVPTFSDLQVSLVLWAHAHLRHASPALVAALYDRLECAEVAAGSSSSSGSSQAYGAASTADASSGPAAGPEPLVLHNTSAAINLCYALARLARSAEARPLPGGVPRLAAALLAEAEAAEAAAEEASLELEGQMGGWGGLDSAEDVDGDAGEAGVAAQQRGGSGGGSSSGGGDGSGDGSSSGGGDGSAGRTGPGGRGTAPNGISLAACDPRGLCLLMWSLAELGACPPALLRHSMATLCRRRELPHLSLQSISHLLLAAQRLAAAPLSEPHEPEVLDSEWGAAVLSGAQRERQRQQQRFRWDQGFMDAVAAELARRAKRAQRAQQQLEKQQQQLGKQPRPGQQHRQQRPPRPFQLNELDCSSLARAFAAAWQEAAAASGAATDNRLKVAGAIRRHVDASPARRAVLSLLQERCRALAPRMGLHTLSALAQAFASIGTCPPELLDAFAKRAVELEREQRLDVQGVSNLAWAYSTLQYDHPQLFDVLAGAALRMLRTQPSAANPGGSSSFCSSSSSSSSSSRDGRGGSRGSAAGTSSSSCTRADFSAQAVSVLAFSFASANRCASAAQRQMYALLAERADEVLEDFTPQGLANLAWGLTVAACYPPQLVRRWRTLAGGRAVQFGPAELNQLHLVEVALRLEAPEIGLETPAEAQSFFDSLYRAGRLRAFAGAGWAANQAGGPRSVTDFQRQVHGAVCALGVPCVLEHSQAGEYSIDVAIPSHRIAVEVDGPVHFATNSRHLMGGTALKRRLLQRLGWQAVAVPFYDWWHLTPAQRAPYMRRKLQDAGLRLDGRDGQAAHSSGAQQQRRRQHTGQRQGQQRQQQQQQQRLPAVEQRQQQAAGGAPEPPPELAAATEQREQQAAAGELLTGAGPGNSDGAQAVEGSPPAGLAQRAQRLSMMQYKKGQLSKAGLLARGSLQAAAAGGKPGRGDAGSDDASGRSGDAPPAP